MLGKPAISFADNQENTSRSVSVGVFYFLLDFMRFYEILYFVFFPFYYFILFSE